MDQKIEKLATVAFPRVFLEGVYRYLRIDIEGLEHLPKRGKALLFSNHSSCFGIDAAMLGYALFRKIHRIPRILTLWTLFDLVPPLGRVAKKMGLERANFHAGMRLLKRNHLTIVFPEGENGSFKPATQLYRIQPFKSGFIRMAILTRSPLIPCIIIGAEESNLNLGSIQFGRWLKGLKIPLPLNVLPIPSKWKIRILPPVDLSFFNKRDILNQDKMNKLTETLRKYLQDQIDLELSKRPSVFFIRKPTSTKAS